MPGRHARQATSRTGSGRVPRRPRSGHWRRGVHQARLHFVKQRPRMAEPRRARRGRSAQAPGREVRHALLSPGRSTRVRADRRPSCRSSDQARQRRRIHGKQQRVGRPGRSRANCSVAWRLLHKLRALEESTTAAHGIFVAPDGPRRFQRICSARFVDPLDHPTTKACGTGIYATASMDSSSQRVTAASHGCRSGGPPIGCRRAPARRPVRSSDPGVAGRSHPCGSECADGRGAGTTSGRGGGGTPPGQSVRHAATSSLSAYSTGSPDAATSCATPSTS